MPLDLGEEQRAADCFFLVGGGGSIAPWVLCQVEEKLSSKGWGQPPSGVSHEVCPLF